MLSKKLVGALLVIAGGFFLLLQLIGNTLSFNYKDGDYWPLIVLTIGVIFEAICYFTKKATGLIIPGGILTIIGFLFFFEVATDFKYAIYTWPVYILSVAVGLYQYYAFNKTNNQLKTASLIIAGISLLAEIILIFTAVLQWIEFGVLFPIVLIVIGVLFLVKASLKGKKEDLEVNVVE